MAAPSLPIAPPRLTVFDVGSETCPQGQLPGAAVFSDQDALHVLNPLQHLPIGGMIYRQATGETLPAPLSIASSVAVGAVMGPVGVLGSVLLNFAMEILTLKPDTSRPAVPEGMSETGAERPMGAVTPGSIATPGGYTTLATVLPDFLGGGAVMGPDGAPVRQAIAAYTAGTMTGFG